MSDFSAKADSADLSREIRLVSRERDDILPKHFAVFTLELHHYSLKNCDLDSNTHAIFFLNDSNSATRASLHSDTVEDLIRISVEGASLEDFDSRERVV